MEPKFNLTAPFSSEKSLRLLKQPSLSSLTITENQKRLTQWVDINHTRVKKQISAPKLHYTQRDYSNLLRKLDKITVNKAQAEEHILLHENKTMKFLFEKGEEETFKIDSEHKKTPLRLSIIKETGKLIGFLSRKTKYPNEDMFDEIVRQEEHQTIDSTYKFTCQYIYILIKALEDTSFAITAKFGSRISSSVNIVRKNKEIASKKIHTLNLLKNNEDLRSTLNEKVSRLLKKRRKELKFQHKFKNFIGENKRIKQSAERLELLEEQIIERDRKRKATTVSRQRLERAKEDTRKLLRYQNLYRQKLKEEKAKMLVANEIKRRSESILISILYLLKASQALKVATYNFKLYKKLKQKENRFSILIQERYRNWRSNHFEEVDFGLLRARNSLLLYRKNNNFRSSELIFEFLKDSAEQSKVNIILKGFIKKVIKIERGIREYVELERVIWNAIIEEWNSAFLAMGNTSLPPVRLRNSILIQYINEKKKDALRKKINYDPFPSPSELKLLVSMAINRNFY